MLFITYGNICFLTGILVGGLYNTHSHQLIKVCFRWVFKKHHVENKGLNMIHSFYHPILFLLITIIFCLQSGYSSKKKTKKNE